MKRLVMLATVLAFGSSAAFAVPVCVAPKEKWIKEVDFKDRLASQGYQVKIFKVTKEQCYEMQGMDRDGRAVQIYFDPATAVIVEQR